MAEDNWSLIDDTRLITHGEIVWGHQFGFIRDVRFCDSEDRINRLLSTKNKVSRPWVGRTKRAS